MTQNKRVRKTLNRKLRDLDDHLYLLEGALRRLNAGDSAQLKVLAGELRVLVCRSSGTDGLLWRIADDLAVADIVHVHALKRVNENHPLAQNLEIAVVPVRLAGQGQSLPEPTHCSLKTVIREYEAVYLSGSPYTHEKLISAVAQQIGSAHEDEGVEEPLVRLTEIRMGDRLALAEVLASDAEVVLHVGQRVLKDAQQKLGFERAQRPVLHIPDDPPQLLEDHSQSDFEGRTPELPETGSVAFTVFHEHPDWQTNSQGYNFPELISGPLHVSAHKLPNATLVIAIGGLHDHLICAWGRIPAPTQPRMMIIITWSPEQIVIYINGEKVNVIPVPVEPRPPQ